MAQSFRIETLDRSGRWYLTPGSTAIYDLRVRNDSKNAVDCSLVVEDPATGVSVEPHVFSLQGHEVRNVTVTFKPEGSSVRSHRVLLSLHADDDGRLLATFEHPLVATGGSDCSVAMAFKRPIIESGRLHGFEMTCSIRSQSEGRSTFQVSLSPHPAFAIPDLPALALDPGQVGEVDVPVLWDRAVKDGNGWNHPTMLELSVPVSNGRRTSRLRWEIIESKLEPFTKNGASSANGTAVVAAPAPTKVEPAKSELDPVKPAAVIPLTAPAIAEASEARVTQTPAAAAAAVKEAPKATPASTPPAPLLMLNGFVERLMLAAPVDAKPAPAVNGAIATERIDAEIIELPLFAALPPQTKNLEPVQPQVAAAASAAPATAPPEAPAPIKEQPAAHVPQVQKISELPKPPAAPVQTGTNPATSPQWKIVSSESFDASAAAAKAAATIQAPPPATSPTAPSQAAPSQAAPSPEAPTTSSGASTNAELPSAPAGPAPKLTPYAPAKWDANGESIAPERATPKAVVLDKPAAVEKLAQPATAAEVQAVAAPAPVVRERQTIKPILHRRARPGLLIGGLAAVAIVIGVIVLKPSSHLQTPIGGVATATQPVVANNTANTTHAAPVATVRKAIPHAVKPTQVVKPTVAAATPAPTTNAATPRPATPRPATPAPATPKPAAQKPTVVAARPPVQRPQPQRHVARYGKLYQPESGSVVALGGIEAYYGPRGRAVRVLWSAAEQASATVQLIDDHGATVNSVSVRGARMSAILYLPRGYHGGLTVQVSSIGRLGERVAQTTSLPPFGN